MGCVLTSPEVVILDIYLLLSITVVHRLGECSVPQGTSPSSFLAGENTPGIADSCLLAKDQIAEMLCPSVPLTAFSKATPA